MNKESRSRTTITKWIAERCNKQASEAESPSTSLYADYLEWCATKEIWFVGKVWFNKTLIGMGFHCRKSGRSVIFRGLSISPDWLKSTEKALTKQ